MRFSGLAALSVAAFAATAPATVSAQTYWDVEAARANARAGGPTNAYDADLLARYGCLSGTRSAFCQRQARGERPYYRSYRKTRRSARR
jgi:hypothetical protein